MKSILSGFAIVLVLSLTSCGSSSTKGNANSTDSTKTATPAAPAAAAPTMTVNEADWVEQDMSTISPLEPVTLKLPKGVKMEKNGNGGVDIHISDFYMITVGTNASSSIKEAMDGDKSLGVNNTTSYQNGKLVLDEPTGFIATYQMKDEANGTKYQPETHFAFYLIKDGAIYTIMDQRPLDNFSVAGSAYSEDIAKKVYAIVKASAKVK